MTVTIARACPEDLPALAEINRLKYCRETVVQFAFENWPDEKNMFKFFKARLSKRFEHAATQVFKAIDTGTNTISGFNCLSLEKGNEAAVGAQKPATDLTPTAKIIQQLPPYMDHEFVLKSGAEIEEMKGLMRGGEHDCKSSHYWLFDQDSDLFTNVSAFAVESRSQGKGIGSQLLKTCLDVAYQASLQIWLTRFLVPTTCINASDLKTSITGIRILVRGTRASFVDMAFTGNMRWCEAENGQDSGTRVQKVGRDSNSASCSFFPRTVISDSTNDL